MLHGVSLSHITSGVKEKEAQSELNSLEENIENTATSSSNEEESDARAEVEEEDLPSVVDEEMATANDNVHRRLNSRSVLTEIAKNDDSMSGTTAGSTSAESYDVIGELSINSNSVEDTLVRIWDNDVHLTEVIPIFWPWLCFEDHFVLVYFKFKRKQRKQFYFERIWTHREVLIF